jgi:hypothetical protein
LEIGGALLGIRTGEKKPGWAGLIMECEILRIKNFKQHLVMLCA